MSALWVLTKSKKKVIDTLQWGIQPYLEYGFGSDDEFTLTVGGNSLTVSQGSSGGALTLAGISASLTSSWTAKYGASGTGRCDQHSVASNWHRMPIGYGVPTNLGHSRHQT